MVKSMARELASGSDGDIYDGEWKDDKQHGKGTFKWPHGDMYEGEWKNDKAHGKGTFKWPHGDMYEGEWKDHYMLDKAETDEFGSCGVAWFCLAPSHQARRPPVCPENLLKKKPKHCVGRGTGPLSESNIGR